MAESASLYRRHRPLSFGEVVGQEHVVRTLSNAVTRDKVHHAYLFVGSRGTGKTSMAKILARSLNCVNGPTLTPCGVCEACTSIAAGHSLDVIEMDAASNRSVDDIRELRERVGYAPAEGHSKVYILDEAHMLTKEAWNAFLKTLEEPPPNTVFVLATTEAQKVMPTIVDRCQRFDFQRPSLDQIGEVVRRVAKAEAIEVDDGAVALISRAASGSFRDALGTLDQLTSFGEAGVKTDDVIELLGAADADLLFGVTDAIAAGDAKGVLEAVEALSDSGRDPGQFARDLIAHLRQLLVARTTGKVPDSFTVTLAQPDRLAEQAGRTGAAQLVAAIDALSGAVGAMREGDDPRLSLEVALLKVAQPSLDPSREALLRRIEQLETRMREGGAPAAEPGPSAASPDRPAAEPQAGGEQPAEPGPPAGEKQPAEEPAPEAPPAETPLAETALAQEQPAEPQQGEPGPAASPEPPLELEAITNLWPAVIDHIRQSGAAMLASVFEGARPTDVLAERAQLRIGFPESAKFNKRKAEAPDNVTITADAIEAIVGQRLTPIYDLVEGEFEPLAAASVEPVLGEDEVIDMIKSNFDASEVVPDLAPESAPPGEEEAS